MKRSLVAVIALSSLVLGACKRKPEHAPLSVLETISHLAAQGEALKAVPFPIVVEGSTGKKVLPVNANSSPGAELIAAISTAVSAALDRLNRDDSPVRDLRRINEASRFFEDEIMQRLNSSEEFHCELPPTAAGKAQRSGYPDLKLTHRASGRVTYLDPKLFEHRSRKSTLRTFYFEPKTETNKILEDAHHLLVGIEHDGNDGAWQFTDWHLVDLSKLVVKLKPEFQASNRDVYQIEAILRSGQGTDASP
ncbi:MAG: ribosomal silencing factor RsfS [Pseudoalteromonas tetraodonis]|jgi:ribosomal silencing factor RsfS